MLVCPFCHYQNNDDTVNCSGCGKKIREAEIIGVGDGFLKNFKLLVIGGGSIGKRQIGNFIISGLKPEQITLVDPREDRRKQNSDIYGSIKTCVTEDEAYSADKYDGVLIASPTIFHISQGMRALDEGCNIFLEKAISHSEDGVEVFLHKADELGKVIFVGYTYRFWPPLHKVDEILKSGVLGRVLAFRSEFSEYLPDWHPWETEDVNGKKKPNFYMAQKSLGGGELLDESHAIDYVRWLLGEVKAVAGFSGTVSDIVMDTDDYAQIITVLDNGVVGNIHLDCFGRNHRKQMDVICVDGNVYWDFYANEVRVYYAKDGHTEIFPFKNKCERNDMFLAECKHFLDCIKDGVKPVVDGWDALKTLKVCTAVMDSWRDKQFKDVK